MSDAPECECPYTDPSTWLSAASLGYGSGYEPGSMQEWNPDCPAHPPSTPAVDPHLWPPEAGEVLGCKVCATVHPARCPIHKPVHLVTLEELDQMREAMARDIEAGTYVPDGMVEVDNPFRREVRPRRGTERQP